jgi:hypothetical protein
MVIRLDGCRLPNNDAVHVISGWSTDTQQQTEWEMHMQAQTIDARIVLMIRAFVFVLIVAVATPMIASADDEQDRHAECSIGGYETYLECFEDTVGNSDERGPAAVTRPAIVLGTLSDFLFIELNMWGADFDLTPAGTPYFPSPVRDSIIDSQITTY